LHLDGGQARTREERVDLPQSPMSALTTADQALFAALKARRLELARSEKQPAYVIFPDRTLTEMASRHPRTIEDMAAIHGVGEAKLARYGRIFLDVIDRHAAGSR
jgi:ATP-dependent DNA helicase RecQ